jgi:ubiquinone/menaquinone biosynthesis C-methylase UbiE
MRIPSVKRILRELPRRILHPCSVNASPEYQDIDVYWDSKMEKLLEVWGEGTVWNEIQLLMVNCRGKVLDIACGTGKTMEIVSSLPFVELYGCDISDVLIKKAKDRGIPEDRLVVCDATRTHYADSTFDHAYSIGSLEHFTAEGIKQCIAECDRIVKGTTFHMVPVSKSGKDDGWITTYQSFFNNSSQWWTDNFGSIYDRIYVLDSYWHDRISVGKWFVCMKESE